MSKFTVKGIHIPTPYIHKKGYRIGDIRNNLDQSTSAHFPTADYSLELFFIRRPEVLVSIPLIQTGYVDNGADKALPFDEYVVKPIDAGVHVFYCTSASVTTWESPEKMPKMGNGTREKPFTNLTYALEKVGCIYNMMGDSVCCNGVKIIVDGIIDYSFGFYTSPHINVERPFIIDLSGASFSVGKNQPEFKWTFPTESYIEGMKLKVYLDNVKLSLGRGCVFLNCEFDVSGTSNNNTVFDLMGSHLYDTLINIKNCHSSIDCLRDTFYRRLQDGSMVIYGCGIYNTSIKGTFSRNQESSSLFIDGHVMYNVNTEADCIKDHFGFRCRGDYGYNVQVKLVAEAHLRQGTASFDYAENVSLNFQNLLYNGDSYGLYLGTGINCHSTVTCGVNSHSCGMGVHIGKNCSSSISYNDYESKIQDICSGSECEQNMCYTRLCPDGTRFLINSTEAPICAYDDGINPVLYNCRATQPAVVYATWIKEGYRPSTPEEYFASGTIVKYPISNDRCYIRVD